ncbi:MAG: hypothetical protein U0941_25850 [Planctomycetaceae bacterium]
MGKPFEDELQALPATYLWSMSQPIEGLVRAVDRSFSGPLLAVGSGGSYTACHFVRYLHETFAQQPAIALTPLQAVDGRTPTSRMSVLVPTAGGNNPDVVAAVRLLTEQEPRSVLVVCGDPESKVAALARRYEMIDFVPFLLPAGKDGFLATNSLVAFCVVLTRAYAEVAGRPSQLPKNLKSLLTETRSRRKNSSEDKGYQALLERDTLVVLHGPSTSAAAVDIESKFTEAALGTVQFADYRQFAHGRHHWIAKNPLTTAVLSLESADDVEVASQTLSLLPESLPVKRISLSQQGPIADLAGIVEGFYLAGAAGRARGIDPGRPGVPSFGRRLYHTNAFRRSRNRSAIPPWKIRPIERKACHSIEYLISEDRLSFWLSAFDNVVEQFLGTRFQGLVVDYDGTLCHEDRRFEALPSDIASALLGLLKGGLILGVATGRGKSVRNRLRESLPQKYWPQVIVGYYNGAELLPLNDQQLPDGTEGVGEELTELAHAFLSDGLLKSAKITLRRKQITLNQLRGLSLQALCEHAEAISNQLAPNSVRVMRSGHSVDIVPQSVTKLAVVQRVQQLVGQDAAPILRIGDRGRWPGNDGQLLASPFGLSSHEVSSDSSCCWNLAPAGHRGHQATLGYLKQLLINNRGIRFQWRPGRGGQR